MISTTGWVLRTWIKTTLLLGLLLGAVWLWLGSDSGWFWAAVLAAALVQCWLVRQLAREWSWQARGSWWWAR